MVLHFMVTNQLKEENMDTSFPYSVLEHFEYFSCD